MTRPPPSPTLFPYTTLFRSPRKVPCRRGADRGAAQSRCGSGAGGLFPRLPHSLSRSEEHTSELQSHHDLVCRLLLEKKKMKCLRSYLTQRTSTLLPVLTVSK